VHGELALKGRGVRVNGVPIPRDAIAREVQQHPAKTPAEALKAAARALVVRELLLQEARRLALVAAPLVDADGRRETDEDAVVRALIEREVRTPDPDEETCRRYYEQNRSKFRSPDLYEAAHILFAAARSDAEAYARAKERAAAALAILQQAPERFAETARTHSACPSAAQGGALGQIAADQTTPEFAQALASMTPGALALAETRYGVHIIRLERRIEGRQLPFEFAAEKIAAYLAASVRHRAIAQFIARLVSRATIEGVALADADALRVH
jgi:peptidyl-prolyl cis-trans isomerase C